MSTQTAKTNTATTPEAETDWKPKVDWDLVQCAKRTGQASEAYREMIEKASNAIEKSVYMAQGIAEIKAMLLQPKMLGMLRSLSCNPLGFLCDKPSKKDQTPYSDFELVNAATEAALRGLRFTGNEFNIISGRCYAAQSGLMRLVKDFPGLTDLVLMPGLPRDDAGQRVVTFGAAWKLHGKEMKLSNPKGEPFISIPVITNDYMTADALIGKATRKALARIYGMISGVEISDGEADQSITPVPIPQPGKHSVKKPTPVAEVTPPAELLDPVDAMAIRIRKATTQAQLAEGRKLIEAGTWGLDDLDFLKDEWDKRAEQLKGKK